jgi:hypothetical protein
MPSSEALRIQKLTAILAVALFAAGCNDDLGPGAWDQSRPDTIQLFSLTRAEYQGLPAALDLVNRAAVVVESGVGVTWDFAVTESNGQVLLTPAGTFQGVESVAGIARIEGETFESLTRAPSDTAVYRRREGVAMEVGRVYAVRSRRYSLYGQGCVRFGKLSPIAVDKDAGVLWVELLRNPNCNDRSLVPSD